MAPPIGGTMIPGYVVAEARSYARDTTRAALESLFGEDGLVDRELARRRSAAFALERSRFHGRMADALPLLGGVAPWRIRRHERLALTWSARAVARDPRLADVCSLRECS